MRFVTTALVIGSLTFSAYRFLMPLLGQPAGSQARVEQPARPAADSVPPPVTGGAVTSELQPPTDIPAQDIAGLPRTRGLPPESPPAATDTMPSIEATETRNAASTGARIGVESNPAGAAIWLDGIDTNRVTPSSITVTTDRDHFLELRMDGYYREQTQLTSGELLTHGAQTVLMLMQPIEPATSASTGWISGFVIDPDGGPLGGVTVTLHSRLVPPITVYTQDDGWFVFPSLPPSDAGEYAITVTLPGFRTVLRESLNVRAGANTQVDFTMVLG